jgi:hypothetical protein
LFAGPTKNTDIGKSENNGSPLQEKDEAQTNGHSNAPNETQL